MHAHVQTNTILTDSSHCLLLSHFPQIMVPAAKKTLTLAQMRKKRTNELQADLLLRCGQIVVLVVANSLEEGNSFAEKLSWQLLRLCLGISDEVLVQVATATAISRKVGLLWVSTFVSGDRCVSYNRIECTQGRTKIRSIWLQLGKEFKNENITNYAGTAETCLLCPRLVVKAMRLPVIAKAIADVVSKLGEFLTYVYGPEWKASQPAIPTEPRIFAIADSTPVVPTTSSEEVEDEEEIVMLLTTMADVTGSEAPLAPNSAKCSTSVSPATAPTCEPNKHGKTSVSSTTDRNTHAPVDVDHDIAPVGAQVNGFKHSVRPKKRARTGSNAVTTSSSSSSPLSLALHAHGDRTECHEAAGSNAEVHAPMSNGKEPKHRPGATNKLVGGSVVESKPKKLQAEKSKELGEKKKRKKSRAPDVPSDKGKVSEHRPGEMNECLRVSAVPTKSRPRDVPMRGIKHNEKHHQGFMCEVGQIQDLVSFIANFQLCDACKIPLTLLKPRATGVAMSFELACGCPGSETTRWCSSPNAQPFFTNA
jgi:hypothetical protein